MILELSGLKRFGLVEPPPQTHVKLNRRPGSLCYVMVQSDMSHTAQ